MRRDLAEHRVPGVCASLLGFLLSFAGAMLISLGVMKQDFDNQTIRIAGPFCLTAGIAIVIAGFSHQFIVHRKVKRRRQRREDYRRRKSASYTNPALQTDEIVLAVDQFSDPGPSSSGLNSGHNSSLNSSWSSLSEIPDESEQRKSADQRKKTDFSIFCTQSSSSAVLSEGLKKTFQDGSTPFRKCSDASKVKRSSTPAISVTSPDDEVVEIT